MRSFIRQFCSNSPPVTTAYARLRRIPFPVVCGRGCPFVLFWQPITWFVFIFSIISCHSFSGILPFGRIQSAYFGFSRSNLYPMPPVRSSSPCVTVDAAIRS